MNIFRCESKKLLRLLVKDPKSLLAGIIAPTVILLVFFLTLGNFSSLRLAVVNHDRGEYGAALVTSIGEQISPLGAKPYFTLLQMKGDTALALYEADKVSGILFIDENFSTQLREHKSGSVQYMFNNYNSDMAKNLRLYLQEGVLAFQQTHNVNMEGLEVREQYNVQKQIDWFHIIAVGVYMLAFFMGAMFNFLYLFQKEKVYGTLFEYNLSPRHIGPSFWARVGVALAAGLITSMVNALFIYALTGINLLRFAFDIGPVMVCLGLTYIFLACLIGLWAESFNGSAVFSMVLAVLLWFLSGATASVNYATGILKTVALLIPNSYGLAQIRDIVFSMTMSDLNYTKGWLLMLSYMTVLMVISRYMYGRKLNRHIR